MSPLLSAALGCGVSERMPFKMAKLGFLFVLIVCLFRSGLGDVLCEPGFCRSYLQDPGCVAPAQQCRINNATHSGLPLPSPTPCNCCEYCLPYIVEGAPCSIGGPGLGTTIGRCGPGLTCERDPNGGSFCRRMRTDCHKAQDDYDERLLNGETGAMEERPECEGKGMYAAFACVPTQTCFCQTVKGERAFGEILYTGSSVKQNMHCGCSKFHEQMKQSNSLTFRFPVIGPRCTADGNFNPIQCVHNNCFCVNRVTGLAEDGQRHSISLLESPLTSLECYKPEFDLFPHQSVGEPPFNYTTPCLENMKERIDFIEESEEAGYNVNHASNLVECLPDGTFGRIVTTNNRSKICVDERRRPIGNYEAFRNTPEYDNMDCKCALTSLLMASSTERPVCCRNGNFRQIQCRRGLCRCVDSDGRQVGMEQTDVSSLHCYKEGWRSC